MKIKLIINEHNMLKHRYELYDDSGELIDYSAHYNKHLAKIRIKTKARVYTKRLIKKRLWGILRWSRENSNWEVMEK